MHFIAEVGFWLIAIVVIAFALGPAVAQIVKGLGDKDDE